MTINVSQHYNKHIKKLNQNHFIYKVKKAFYLLTSQEERLYEVGFSEGFLYAAELMQKKPILDSNDKKQINIKYKKANIEVVSKLVDKVCERYTVSKHDVFSKGRTTDVVRARSIVYNLLHEEYNVSISSMARVFDQDHTTVINSLKNKKEKRRYWNQGDTIWDEFEELRRITF
ncbi:dnaA chromosomal replication initiation protein-like [uncultured Mediterranean phage uvMED]|nr:dnaA chromosomal replication initiation protein-like [uncultured Mediterranean phage uvMED]